LTVDNNQEQLHQLYARFISNEISAEEMKQFFSLLKEDGNLPLLEQLMDTNWETMFDGVQAAEPIKKVLFYRRSWIRVAAAILILISCSTYFFIKKQPAVNVPAAVAYKDIQPGSNKATLTLANGQKIILEDVKYGTVAQQGGTRVSKLANGQLAYVIDSNSTAVIYNTLSTPRGGQHYLLLPDGSSVWLNAASSIRFPTAFTGKERVVEITGEVYFEVAQRAAMPFKVKFHHGEVQVLGTQFNINAYDDEDAVKTTLLEGLVRVSGHNSSVIIKPGSQALLGKNEPVRASGSVNTDEVMAWKNGVFYFNRSDIKTIMRQISRWYDVDIEYRGTIRQREFVGDISKKSQLPDVLAILEESNVHFIREGRKIIVIP
jgi:transmembrane sensor